MESASAYFLPRLIGFSNAMYLVSTGAVLPPTARQFGDLFAETLPDPTRVFPRALQLAEDIAQNVSPLASHLSRALMWRGPDSPEEAHLLDSSVIYHMFGGKCVFSLVIVVGRCDADYPGTRKRASRRSSRRGSPSSRRPSMTSRRIIPGGMRLISRNARGVSGRTPSCNT